jgi:hypothetical protein
MPHPEQGAGRNHADGGHSSREMFCAIVYQRKRQLANDKKAAAERPPHPLVRKFERLWRGRLYDLRC